MTDLTLDYKEYFFKIMYFIFLHKISCIVTNSLAASRFNIDNINLANSFKRDVITQPSFYIDQLNKPILKRDHEPYGKEPIITNTGIKYPIISDKGKTTFEVDMRRKYGYYPTGKDFTLE